MSNYLFAFGRTDVICEISDHLAILVDSEGENELVLTEESKGLSSLTVTRPIQDGSSSRPVHESSDGVREGYFFRGWLVDHHAKHICLGERGLGEYLRTERRDSLTASSLDKEGAYVLASWGDARLTFENDIFSQLPALFFSTSEVVVVSDSLYVLSRVRMMMGLENKINRDVIHSRTWTHGLASAAMSNELIIKDVFMLTPSSYLDVDLNLMRKSKKFGISTRKPANLVVRECKSVFSGSATDYSEGLQDGINQVRSLLSTVAGLGIRLRFGLSGGLDSRVLFATIQDVQVVMDGLDIKSSTHESRIDDLRVVRMMSERMSFEFNNESSVPSTTPKGIDILRISNPFGHWVISNAGIFDMFYLYNSYWSNPVVAELGGHGAEVIKGTFYGLTLRDIPLAKREGDRESIYSEIEGTLADHGISESDPAAMQWHHLLYKSAIQNGRFVRRNLLGLRPFLNQTLCSLALSDINPHRHSSEKGYGLMLDMLSLCCKDLATIPFTNPKYDMTPEQVDERITGLSGGGPLPTPQIYCVSGGVKDISNGPCATFMALVEHLEIEMDDQKGELLRLVEEFWSQVADGAEKEVYSMAYSAAKKWLSDSSKATPNAGTPAAKLVSIAILFGNPVLKFGVDAKSEPARQSSE